MMILRAGCFLSALTVGTALCLMVSCAQLGTPQGGPPDVTPPAVEMTRPGSGDVLVARDAGLSLQFSEPLDKNTITGNLEISPSRSGQAEYKWSNGSRRVDITWPDSLRDSTTYRMTVNNRVADRHGNKFPEPYTFAFSTGAQVDRGEIRGHVRSEGDKSGAYDVFAYRLETMPDTFWLSPPDYATQTGPDGRFQLPFLRAGRYRLLVLADGNRDQRLDHGERFALAARDFAVADEVPPDSADLFPTVRDTVPFTLRNCTPVGHNLIALTFSHPLDTGDAANWMITAFDSVSGVPVEFQRLNPTPRRTNAVTLSGQWTTGSVYTITVAHILDQRGHHLDSDTCHCAYVAITDSLGPKIEWVTLPAENEALTIRDPIQWFFSEPVDTSRFTGAATVRDTVGGDIGGHWQWRDVQTLIFTPDPAWPDTTIVYAVIDSTRLADAAGNLSRPGTYKWRFTPLGESRQGEIEGRIESSLPAPAVFWLEARAIGDARRIRVRTTAPGPLLLVLPAGRWQLGGFVDADDDGRWYPGSVSPFRHSELRMIRSDTLDVRARFTLEDIILRF